MDLKEKCFLSNDIRDYWYVSQGKLTVPSIDDREDMQFANEAFDILGFSEEMKYDVFKNTACMMHMGNMTKDFVPVGKEAQAEGRHRVGAEGLNLPGCCQLRCRHCPCHLRAYLQDCCGRLVTDVHNNPE